MKPPVMKAIEFNTIMSLLYYFGNIVTTNKAKYNISHSIDISPYILPPADATITKFTKPSIILQRVNTIRSSVGFGNVLGDFYEEETNTTFPVSGKIYDMTYQANIYGRSNIEVLRMVDMLAEEGFPDWKEDWIIELFDFADESNPVSIGRIDVTDDLDIQGGNTKDNYCTTIRIKTQVLQKILRDDQPMVDLSKGFKITIN